MTTDVANVADERQTAGGGTPTPPRKRSWLGRVLVGLLIVVAALVLLIATRPSEFRVARSATMAAPPAAIFEQVNDFRNWDAWSPWAKMDPNATTRFEGPTAGKDATFYWSGNNDIGEGSMTIVESRPNELIRIRLEFVRPFAGTNDVQFTFQPQSDRQTIVTWSIAGENNFMAKAIGLLMDCEQMVGDQFDQGLASIRRIVEKSS